MNVKVIIFDLDKTLLRTDKTLSPYTERVLNECKKCGIKIMIATARPLRGVEAFCRCVEFDALTVSNGARVICGNFRTEFGIDPRCAEALLRTLQQYKSLRITLETGDCAYSNKPIEDYETVICEDLISVAATKGVLKLLVHLDQTDTLDIVKRELSEDLYYTVAHGYLMQIMSRSATKWSGIKTMLQNADCSPCDAVYFGDDYDDVEPIKLCGLGVAVSNGIDEVKVVADCIAESNDDDGVAKFLERVILNGVERK